MLIPSVYNLLRLILPIKSHDSDKICQIFEREVTNSKKVSNLSDHPIRVSISENLTVEVLISYPQNLLSF